MASDWAPSIPGLVSVALLQLDLSSSLLEVGLELLGLFAVDAPLDRARAAGDHRDDLDLLLAGAGQDDGDGIRLLLGFGRSLQLRRRSRSRTPRLPIRARCRPPRPQPAFRLPSSRSASMVKISPRRRAEPRRTPPRPATSRDDYGAIAPPAVCGFGRRQCRGIWPAVARTVQWAGQPAAEAAARSRNAENDGFGTKSF